MGGVGIDCVVGGLMIGGEVARTGGGTTVVGPDMERVAGWADGVGGPELEGDGDGSVIHILSWQS